MITTLLYQILVTYNKKIGTKILCTKRLACLLKGEIMIILFYFIKHTTPRSRNADKDKVQPSKDYVFTSSNDYVFTFSQIPTAHVFPFARKANRPNALHNLNGSIHIRTLTSILTLAVRLPGIHLGFIILVAVSAPALRLVSTRPVLDFLLVLSLFCFWFPP